MPSAERLRLFVAVMIPADVRADVYDKGKRLWQNRTNVSVVRQENLHITLKFLGEAEASAVAGIGRALNEVAAAEQAFDVEAGGVGAFGARRRPSALWVGVTQGQESLAALSRKVERKLVSLGFADENRFRAHITVARIRDRRAGGDELVLPDDEPVGRFAVNAISLMKSTLGRGGSVYEELGSFALGHECAGGDEGNIDG